MTERPAPSETLEQVRKALFPNLPAEEGRARIEEALSGSADDERWQRIEQIAAASDMAEQLLEELRSRKTEQPDEPGA